MTDSNNRQYARFPANFTAEIRLSGHTVDDGAIVRDISRGGVFFETSRVLPKDVDLEIIFDLPGSEGQFSIFGTVCWNRTEPPCGIGVAFMQMLAGDRSPIHRYLEEIEPLEGVEQPTEITEILQPIRDDETLRQENEVLMQLIAQGDLEAIKQRGYIVQPKEPRETEKKKKKKRSPRGKAVKPGRKAKKKKKKKKKSPRKSSKKKKT